MIFLISKVLLFKTWRKQQKYIWPKLQALFSSLSIIHRIWHQELVAKPFEIINGKFN